LGQRQQIFSRCFFHERNEANSSGPELVSERHRH
jgi:hypothetical protein